MNTIRKNPLAVSKKNRLIQQLRQQLQAMSKNTSQLNAPLQQIISHIPGNVYWKNADNVYMGCNLNLARILGLSHPEEIIGKRAEDFLDLADAEAINDADEKVIKHDEELQFEEDGYNNKGEVARYLSSKIPLRDATGKVVGLLGLSFDITERKKIEQELINAKQKAEIASEAKSQFLAVVNHELRTPLTGIVGLVGLLEQQTHQLAHPDIENLIKNLKDCSQYMLNLINDVLDFSRYESGKYKIKLRPVALSELFQDMQQVLSALSKEKALHLDFNFADNLPTVQTDPRMLKQILINISYNAIKFTDKGSVSFKVSVQDSIDGYTALEVIIQDSGKGMPQEKLQAIFEPFFQLDDPYQRQSSRSGTGLGLAIVKRLAKFLNLTINVESELNVGTRFTLRGIFAISEKLAIPAPKAQQQLPLNHAAVLLVEDDLIIQQVHGEMLKNLGFSVSVASNGKEALMLYEKQQFAILIIDIGLPDITGFELIQQLRIQMQLSKVMTPILALTGYTELKEKIACRQAGANEVAAKPIDIIKLKEILSRLISY